ncbi:DUF992 domain-containing protein [Rhizobium sp. 2YAF20]|uniref:DUF992 domain-containing protein n=1 Tax=Rhizobium sp. 2YAF20 TaxID=3233027 RepID=UPI003F966836
MKTLVAIAAISSIAFASAVSAAPVHHKTQHPAPAATGQKERLGTLSCEVAGGIGLLLGSSKNVSCQFVKRTGAIEKYTGSIGKLGIDIGVTNKSYLKWVVYTLNASKSGDHALAGTYVGVSASGTVGVGLGANALVGGTSKNFGLQPLSAEANTGLNVAAGVSRLELIAAK